MRQKGGSRFDKLVPIPLLSPPQTNSKATTFQLILIVLMITPVTLVYLLDPFELISFLSPVKFSDVESCVTICFRNEPAKANVHFWAQSLSISFHGGYFAVSPSIPLAGIRSGVTQYTNAAIPNIVDRHHHW